MRPVKSSAKRAAPKRQAKRTTKRTTKGAAKRAAPKRSTKSTARKKAAPRARGRKVSMARVWERRIEGWRRFFIRHAYMKSYAVLVAITVGAYAIWASGIVGQTSTYISDQTRAATVAVGFTVQRVTLEGHGEISPGEVLDALDLEMGSSIFDLDLQDLRARVEALDWVHRATVVRALPGRVHVIIEEEEPYALWQNQGVLQVVSVDGEVITSAAVERFSHLPHVVGQGAQNRARELFVAIDAIPNLGPRVRYAVRVSDRRWDLHFDSDVVVQLPEENMSGALAALAEYESEYRLLARAISTVDLRLDDRIVVRPRSDNPDQSPTFSLPSAPSSRGERET